MITNVGFVMPCNEEVMANFKEISWQRPQKPQTLQSGHPVSRLRVKPRTFQM
jgi:hypothetical protein